MNEDAFYGIKIIEHIADIYTIRNIKSANILNQKKNLDDLQEIDNHGKLYIRISVRHYSGSCGFCSYSSCHDSKRNKKVVI